MQTSTSNYTYFVQKAIQRKKTQPTRKASLLKECEMIDVQVEIMDECDLEIYLLLQNLPESVDDALDLEIKEMRKSTKNMIDFIMICCGSFTDKFGNVITKWND